jgi:hypothetical protein
MGALKLTQAGKGGQHTQGIRRPSINACQQRLSDFLQGLSPETAAYEPCQTFVPVRRPRWEEILQPHTEFSRP